MAHRAGLPVLERPVSVAQAADPAAMADLLAHQTPLWQPGTEHGYHALTFGWLVGEFVRRHTGLTVGEFTRRHVGDRLLIGARSEEHTSELQSLMRISYAVFCLKKKTNKNK